MTDLIQRIDQQVFQILRHRFAFAIRSTPRADILNFTEDVIRYYQQVNNYEEIVVDWNSLKETGRSVDVFDVDTRLAAELHPVDHRIEGDVIHLSVKIEKGDQGLAYFLSQNLRRNQHQFLTLLALPDGFEFQTVLFGGMDYQEKLAKRKLELEKILQTEIDEINAIIKDFKKQIDEFIAMEVFLKKGMS